MAFLRLLRSVDGVVPGFNWSSNSAILGARESAMTLLGLLWSDDGGILGMNSTPCSLDIGPHFVLDMVHNCILVLIVL